MDVKVHHTRFAVVPGTLSLQGVDALILPTNNYLWFSSVYSEELKRAGGTALEKNAIAQGPINLGTALATPGGRLPCPWVIHAAAWGQDLLTDAIKVRQAVTSALACAEEKGCDVIAIAPGAAVIGDFTLLRAVEAVMLTLLEYAWKYTGVREIRLLAHDHTEESVLNGLLQSAAMALPPHSSSFSEEEDNG